MMAKIKWKLMKWLGIETEVRMRMEAIIEIKDRLDKLEQRWVASGPGKWDVATTSGTKKMLAPTYHSAQSLLDLINKKKL